MTREGASDLFAAVVTVSIACALAPLTWHLVTGFRSQPAALPILAAPRDEIDVAPILAAAPFGSEAGGAPVATSLPLELRGIVADTGGRGAAFIAAPGGVALAYAVGQALPGGGTVDSIAIDHVILATGGRRERLGLPSRPAAAAPAAGGEAPVAAAAPMAPSAPPPPAPGASAPGSPQSILDGLGATPVPNGYRVGETIAPAYRQTGLQPGDIIEQVNGTKLGNPAADQQALAAATRSGTLRIDLVRGDRHITIGLLAR